MLNDNERELPRAQRRALLSQRRGTTQKKTPFGRVKVLDIESGISPTEDRVVYVHRTKGLMDRRMTMPLLSQLIAVG